VDSERPTKQRERVFGGAGDGEKCFVMTVVVRQMRDVFRSMLFKVEGTISCGLNSASQ
jgi:hypothetical protein